MSITPLNFVYHHLHHPCLSLECLSPSPLSLILSIIIPVYLWGVLSPFLSSLILSIIISIIHVYLWSIYHTVLYCQCVTGWDISPIQWNIHSCTVLYCNVYHRVGYFTHSVQYTVHGTVLYCTNFYNTVLYCMFYYFRFGLCWCGHQGLHMDRDAAKVNITVLYCTHFYNTVLYKFVTVVYSTPK